MTDAYLSCYFKAIQRIDIDDVPKELKEILYLFDQHKFSEYLNNNKIIITFELFQYYIDVFMILNLYTFSPTQPVENLCKTMVNHGYCITFADVIKFTYIDLYHNNIAITDNDKIKLKEIIWGDSSCAKVYRKLIDKINDPELNLIKSIVIANKITQSSLTKLHSNLKIKEAYLIMYFKYEYTSSPAEMRIVLDFYASHNIPINEHLMLFRTATTRCNYSRTEALKKHLAIYCINNVKPIINNVNRIVAGKTNNEIYNQQIAKIHKW